MKPGAARFLDVLKLIFSFGKAGRKIAENRRAVRNGRPKPHDPKEIAEDLAGAAQDTADTVRERKHKGLR